MHARAGTFPYVLVATAAELQVWVFGPALALSAAQAARQRVPTSVTFALTAPEGARVVLTPVPRHRRSTGS